MRLKGAVSSTTTIKQPSFDAAGLRVNVVAECRISVVEHWCPITDPQCRPNPTVVKHELTACPKDLAASNVSLRAPWGQVYPGTVAVGVLTVKIDWITAGIDPLDANLALLRTGWVVHSDDGLVDAPLDLTDDELRAMFVAIGKVTDNDVTDAPAGEHATLTTAFSSEPGKSGANRISLSVTNRGPDPAYKVVAQLKSSSTALHGIHLSFGRINRGQTKTRFKDLAPANETDELNPTVVAAVTSANAPAASATGKIRLATKRSLAVPLQLSCNLLDKEPAPGQRLRLQCESTNPGDEAVHGVWYQIAIGKAAATTATGPAELAPHAHVKFELAPVLPGATKLGTSLPISITMNAPDRSPVQQHLAIEVVEFHGLCKQGRLTRDAYRIKRKRLQAALAAGALTQEEFDNYDSEMVSCIE